MSSYTKIILLLFALLIISFMLTNVSNVFWFVALGSMVGFFIMLCVATQKKKKNQQEVKNIKGDFISRNYPEVNFDPDDSISLEEFSSLGIENLLARRSYHLKSGGLVYGNAHGIPFRASRIGISHHVTNSSGSSNTVTDYEGITAVYKISDFYENQIVISGVAVVVGEEPVEMPAFMKKIVNFAMNFEGRNNGLVSENVENLFGKPVRIYSDNLEYAMNFLTDTRILQLKEIPFSNIVINGNYVVLDLPENVAEILKDTEIDEPKKGGIVDFSAGVDPEKVCEETKYILDLILSFPEKLGLL